MADSILRPPYYALQPGVSNITPNDSVRCAFVARALDYVLNSYHAFCCHRRDGSHVIKGRTYRERNMAAVLADIAHTTRGVLSDAKIAFGM